MSRVFQSAEHVAYVRALAARDPRDAVRNPDYLAERLISAKLRRRLRPHFFIHGRMERAVPGAYGFQIARTRFGDDFLKAALLAGTRQVVVLGAGLDSRAVRFGRAFPGATFYEVDVPGNQTAKRERLQAIAPLAELNLRFVPLDLTTGTLPGALDAAGLDPSARTFVFMEGLSYYLPQEKVQAMLRGLVGHVRGGASLVLDYATQDFVGGDHSSYGAEAVAKWLERIGEPFRWGSDPERLRAFLRECGLEGQADLGAPELEAIYLTDREGTRRHRSIALYRLAYATTP